jgi:pyrimidine-nucleoside phosphorylase
MTALPPQVMIRMKRDGERLPHAAIRAFIAGVTDGTIPDYQAAAMLMAIFFRGLDAEELTAWADAMLHSGDVLDLSSIARAKIDKHSTGGVGDKISLPLAPAVAACGVAVPMVSGRGLGHTGGTLDKLESIPGFRVDLSVDDFRAQVDRVGACLIGQTDRIAPADRKLYALRDVTATVESIPLIASSIMSKKLAEGIDGLVLDVKVGRGAFMKDAARARELARTMLAIGRGAGKRVTAVLTDMDQPIGRAVGHSVEVEETIDVLRGGGPPDTRELTIALGAEMLHLAGIDAGRERIAQALDDGRALAKFRDIVVAQGGDPRVCDDPRAVLPFGDEVALGPHRPGVITGIDAEKIGMGVLVLGGGRRRKEDRVDHGVGFVLLKKVGDRVGPGERIGTIYCRAPGPPPAAISLLATAFEIGDEPPAPEPLIHEVIRA